LVWTGKQEMVIDITKSLQAAGFGVTQKAINDAYPGKRGSQLLFGVWRRAEVAPHWAAQKLERHGVAFSHKPPLEPPQPDPADTFFQLSPIRQNWPTFLDRSLPTRDRD